MYPKRLTTSNSTKGERTLFNLLSSKLDDSVTVYYEPKIDKVSPDFLLIGENLGVLILEVKDYSVANLQSANAKEWTFTTGESTESPYSQARRYAFGVSSLLSRDSHLATDKGKFKFNYAYGVVFTNITRLEFIASQLDDVYDMNLTLFKDDLHNISSEDLFDLLFGLHSFTDRLNISEEIRDRIRYHLFPEVRIGDETAKYDEKKLFSLRTLKTMDRYQETLARELGEGHRLLRGVAGSGKTIVLVAKAKLLHDSDPNSSILICCYSVTLVAYIKYLLGSKYKRIQVKTFHEVLASVYGLYDASNLASLEDMIAESIVYRKIYNHVLVDEGQDLDPEWIKFLYDSVKGEEKSFLLCMDAAQTIFKKSLLSLTGIDFRGRSTILSINYRNPKVITDLAWRYYKHYVDEVKTDPDIIPPSSTKGTRGKLKVEKFDTFYDEVEYIASLIKGAEKFSDIAILYRLSKFKEDYIQILMSRLDAKEIPYTWVTRDRKSKSKYNHEENSVKILTVDSSKGLSFPNVFFVGFTTVHPNSFGDLSTLAKRSYIGMTRCTHQLCLTYHEDNILAEGLIME